MAGQIVKRSENSWTVRVFLGRDSEGKRKYTNKTIRGTRKDAQRYLNAKLREKDLGLYVEPSNQFLSEFLHTWLDTCALPRVSGATLASYETIIRVHIGPALGRTKLCDLQKVHIQQFYNDLVHKGYSPRTVRYIHSILSMAMKQAIEWDLIGKNPCATANLPKKSQREMRAFSKDEAREFILAAKQDPLGIVFEFALETGMRPEEYLSLKWSDIDFNSKTATVQRALVWQKGGGWVFNQPKTRSSRRTIHVSATLLEKLRRHKVRQGEHRLRLGSDYQNLNLIFPTDLGTPLHYGNLTKRHFRPILRLAGIAETFRLYDLRHSCATLLLANGANIKVVSERLGHASIKTTLETYAHVLPGMQEGATSQLSNLLYG